MLKLFCLLATALSIFRPILGSFNHARWATTTTEYDDTGPSFSTPFSSLSEVSERNFTTLSHPLFPRYSVRVKKNTDFCDPTVKGYTGYIDIQARHLFFYFFESRNNPDTDDVIFWTNGGPGCSSSLGLFFELGPCMITDANGPRFNPDSWNTNANIFFIDQPIGVGFSYADYGETVSTSEEAAIDVAAFVAIFFENFRQFQGRAFHMAGESYGGRYIPLFASAVYDQNARMVEAGLESINLTSVMIGNGLTDIFKMVLSYYDMECTPASIPPILDITTCVGIKQTLDRCERWTTRSCIEHFDDIDCAAAYSFCQTIISTPYFAINRNPYDISKTCEGVLAETLCYPQTVNIRNFLSNSTNRNMLGVDSAVPQNFTSCSEVVGNNFLIALDTLHVTSDYVAALLDRGIRALIYVGTYDWICNHVGNERWTLELEWSGKKGFVESEKREWIVDGKRAGLTRSFGGFTFATIDGAGHLVPFDKPKEALTLVQRWLSGQDL